MWQKFLAKLRRNFSTAAARSAESRQLAVNRRRAQNAPNLGVTSAGPGCRCDLELRSLL